MVDSAAYWALWIPLAALGVDLVVGDPNKFAHPVRLIGKVLEALGPWASSGGGQKAKGVVCTVLVAGLSGGAAWLLSSIPYAGLIIGLYLAYAGLALGQLLREARKVRLMLDRGDIQAAREALAMLVSRDVSAMDERGLRRSLAESVAENVNDAFAAPFFWLVVAGPGGLWFYKAVSTMDSMWGYKTDTWREAGWACARADDVLAWLPARLTAFIMLAAGVILRMDWRSAYDNLLTDARKTESPNAGWPMAAAAWMVGARMGGPTLYSGQLKDKPRLGPDGDWSDGRLRRLTRLAWVTGVMSGLFMAAYAWAMTVLR